MIINKFNYKALARETVSGSRHYLTPNGDKVPSVTTILDKTKPQKDKDALNNWRKRVGNKQATNITRVAANTGTVMHKKLEEHVLGTLTEAGTNIVQQDGDKMARVVIKEGLCNVSEVWGVEVNLFNSQLYAGTTDCCGIWKNHEAIIDFKQTNKPKKREWIDDYFLQLAAYGDAHNSTYGTNIDAGVIMMCNNLNSPDPLAYQEFSVEGDEWIKYHNMWCDRLSLYYEKYH